MSRVSRLVAMGLLLACAVLQAACSLNGDSSAQPFDARKYWDRCLGAQCPPMDEGDARKK